MDAEKVANLLTIAQYFDLDIYTTSRKEKVRITSADNAFVVESHLQTFHISHSKFKHNVFTFFLLDLFAMFDFILAFGLSDEGHY